MKKPAAVAAQDFSHGCRPWTEIPRWRISRGAAKESFAAPRLMHR